MFKQLDLKVMGGIVIITVLLLAGIHFYSKWSYNRFATEIGEAPQSTTPSEPGPETDKITPSEQSQETQSVNKNVKVKPMVKSELANTGKEMEGSAEKTEASEFDASSLLSNFGMPEEVTSLLDEEAEEEDFEKAQAHLTETYGESPEVEAVIDKLKQLSNSTVQFGDLIELLETWIDVLPEEQHEIRQRLMNSLAQLQQVKGLSGNTPVRFIAAPVLNPTLSGGSDRVTISGGGKARVIQGDESRVTIKDIETKTKDD